MIDMKHNISHTEIKDTHTLKTDCFVSINANKDCTLWAITCLPCQKYKIQKYTKMPLNNFNKLTRRFDNIHVDFRSFISHKKVTIFVHNNR